MTNEANNIFSKKNLYTKNRSNDIEGIEEIRKILIDVLVRVSTDMQAQDGDSIEMQVELAQAYADEIGGTIHKIYIEDGLSASKTRIENRKNIQEIMQDVENGDANLIVSYKRDRLFRNTIEHMQFLQFLADRDCDLHFTARGEVQTDMSQFKISGVSKLMESMLSMMAEMEAANTSSRVSDVMVSKAQRGEFTGGALPVGYMKEGDKYIPIEGSLPTIKLIEDLYLEGFGVKAIARYLNGIEVKGLGKLDTPMYKPSLYARSELWNQRTVETVLFNPFYTGHISYNSKKNVSMDRIIAKSDQILPMRSMETQISLFEMHEKKALDKKPPRAYSTPFLLSGIIYCGECGSPLKTLTSQRKDGVRYSYYKCQNKYTTHGEDCSMNKMYRKELLEKMVLDVASKKLKDFVDSDIYELFLNKINKEKKVAQDQLSAIEEKIKSLNLKLKEYAKMVIELKDDDGLKKVYLAEQRTIFEEIAALEETHKTLAHKIESEAKSNPTFERFFELAKEFHETIADVSINVQKLLLENLYESIYINKEGEVYMSFNFGDSLPKVKVPSFISLDTIRDCKESKNIKSNTINEPNTLDAIQHINASNIESVEFLGEIIYIKYYSPYFASFNFTDSLNSMSEIVRNSYLPFLAILDEKMDLYNAHLIADDDVSSHRDYGKVAWKSKGRWNAYVEIKLGISHMARKFMEKGSIPKLNRMKKQLANFNSNVEEFLLYIKSNHPDLKLSIDDIKELELLYTKDFYKQEQLFSGLIKCAICGHTYSTRMWSYRKYMCVKNNNVKGAIHRCKSVVLDEKALILQYERETDLYVSRESVLNTVEWIEVLSDSTVKFHYKKDTIHNINGIEDLIHQPL